MSSYQQNNSQVSITSSNMMPHVSSVSSTYLPSDVKMRKKVRVPKRNKGSYLEEDQHQSGTLLKSNNTTSVSESTRKSFQLDKYDTIKKKNETEDFSVTGDLIKSVSDLYKNQNRSMDAVSHLSMNNENPHHRNIIYQRNQNNNTKVHLPSPSNNNNYIYNRQDFLERQMAILKQNDDKFVSVLENLNEVYSEDQQMLLVQVNNLMNKLEEQKNALQILYNQQQHQQQELINNNIITTTEKKVINQDKKSSINNQLIEALKKCPPGSKIALLTKKELAEYTKTGIPPPGI